MCFGRFVENDKGYIVRLDFKWIDINELDNYVLRPKILKSLLTNNELEFNHLVVNEMV